MTTKIREVSFKHKWLQSQMSCPADQHMEEEVDGSGQEEQNAACPGASLVAPKQPQHRQEPYTQDQDLPIMHWEDLSLRIAELEKQEEERRKKAEV